MLFMKSLYDSVFAFCDWLSCVLHFAVFVISVEFICVIFKYSPSVFLMLSTGGISPPMDIIFINISPLQLHW